MASPGGRTNWYTATIDRVPASNTVDLILDLGFDIHYRVEMTLDGVMTPDSRSDDPGERDAGMAVQNFIAVWAVDQPDKKVVAHVARVTDRGCTGSIWTVDDEECLNEILVDDGLCLGEDEY